jgi:hypothetical protein
MALTQEQKDRWVAALRSGDYTQTNGCWYSAGGKGGKSHCCLSVLMAIEGAKFSASEWDKGRGPSATDVLLSLGFGSDNLVTPFITANDTNNKTFAEIADMIESGKLVC